MNRRRGLLWPRAAWAGQRGQRERSQVESGCILGENGRHLRRVGHAALLRVTLSTTAAARGRSGEETRQQGQASGVRRAEPRGVAWASASTSTTAGAASGAVADAGGAAGWPKGGGPPPPATGSGRAETARWRVDGARSGPVRRGGHRPQAAVQHRSGGACVVDRTDPCSHMSSQSRGRCDSVVQCTGVGVCMTHDMVSCWHAKTTPAGLCQMRAVCMVPAPAPASEDVEAGA